MHYSGSDDHNDIARVLDIGLRIACQHDEVGSHTCGNVARLRNDQGSRGVGSH